MKIDEDKVVGFFKENPNPPDALFHKFNDEQGYDDHEAEAIAYKMVTKYIRFLTQGKSVKKNITVKDVDQNELAMGVKVELEHTDDLETAVRIALDHLAEFPKYYTGLKKLEASMKPLEEIQKKAFLDELQKIAKILDVEDIEDRLGTYLDDMREQKARNLIEKAYDKSFVLRHPWITGIPTLGIAPAIAQSRAIDAVRRGMLRNDPDLHKVVALAEETQHRRQVESDEANRYANAVREAGEAYLAGKTYDSIYNR